MREIRRERDAEARVAGLREQHLNRAVMRRNRFAADAQAHADALVFRPCREIRLENMRQRVGGNADAGVFHINGKMLRVKLLQAHGEIAAVRHGLNRVQHEVGPDLIQPRRVTDERRNQLVIFAQRDVAGNNRAAQHQQRIVQILFQMSFEQFGLVLMRVVF